MTSDAETTHAPREASRPKPASAGLARRLVGRGPLVVLAVGVVAQLLLSLYFGRNGWFGVDSIHYFAHRGPVPGQDEGLLEPYAGHLQPALITLYRLLFAGFGMHHYLPYALVPMLLHLAIAVLMYLLLVRVGCSAWAAVTPVWLLLFFGSGAEAFLSDEPQALTWPVALSLGALLVCLRWTDSDRAGWVAAALLVLGVMFSVTGVVGFVLVGVFLAGHSGLPRAARVVGPGVLAFGVWFAVLGRSGGRVDVHGAEYLDVPQLALRALVTPLGDLLGGVQTVGAVLTLALVVATFLVRPVPRSLRELAWAGIVAACAQATLSALANAGNPDGVEVGRYQYVILVLLLPGAAVALSGLLVAARGLAGPSRPVGAALVLVVGITATTLNGIAEERRVSFFVSAKGDQYRAYVLGVLAATDRGEEILTTWVPGSFAQALDIDRLARVRAQVPSDVTAQQQIIAESAFFVGVRPGQDFGYAGAVDLAVLQGLDPAALPTGGCETYQATTLSPEIDLAVGQGIEIGVQSNATQITTILSRDGVTGPPREWAVTPGQAQFIASTAQDATLAIRFNAGDKYLICAGG